jgi:hypothetical protein
MFELANYISPEFIRLTSRRRKDIIEKFLDFARHEKSKAESWLDFVTDKITLWK